jgi:hypothetical protein
MNSLSVAAGFRSYLPAADIEQLSLRIQQAEHSVLPLPFSFLAVP